MRGRTKKIGAPPLCPIEMRPGEAQWAESPTRFAGRDLAGKNSFLLGQPFAHIGGTPSEPARGRGDRLKAPRLALRRRNIKSCRPGQVSNCWDARHLPALLSRNHAGDGRSAVGGALARHMPRHRQLGGDLPQ
jgi:hypothetical protein